MSEIKLSWAEAEVVEGELKVPLGVEPSEEWREAFERTVRLLGGGDWGEVGLEDGAVSVAGLQPGEEEKVRHFLEAVVEQAGAAEQAQEEAEAESSRAQGDDQDAEMASRFREFGQPQPEA